MTGTHKGCNLVGIQTPVVMPDYDSSSFPTQSGLLPWTRSLLAVQLMGTVCCSGTGRKCNYSSKPDPCEVRKDLRKIYSRKDLDQLRDQSSAAYCLS